MPAMLRSILAILAAAILNFIYGWISWGMLPWHQPKPFENEDAVVKAIRANTSEHAIYSYPDWSEMQNAGDKEGQEAYLKKWSDGPAIYAMVRPGKREDASMGTGMFSGFLVSILASSILFLLILKSGHSTFRDRVLVAFLAGVFLGVVSALYPWNWLEYPGMATIASLCDGIIPWTLAGVVIALLMPKAKHA